MAATSPALSGEFTLHPGSPRDWLALSWLIETSPFVHWYIGRRDLKELLAEYPSYLWLRATTARAVVLIKTASAVGVDLCLVAFRARGDVRPFCQWVLPEIERQLAARGCDWLSINDPPDWLVDELAQGGYALKERVIYYRKEGLEVPPEVSAAANGTAVNTYQASDADLPLVLDVDALAFEPFWRLDEQEARRYLAEAAVVLLARVRERVAGYLVAERFGSEAYIDRLAVAPAFQGQGIATRLIAEALSRLRADGVQGVALNTQESNTRSRRLYERLGFQLTGETHVIWARGIRPPASEPGTGEQTPHET